MVKSKTRVGREAQKRDGEGLVVLHGSKTRVGDYLIEQEDSFVYLAPKEIKFHTLLY